ncbi:alpha/beta fold hydrolase [Herbiconiux liukaitaii]|uniref:alpha/beta fold hydrolase n=1 Tax=Herbiconiux liukaitaii TaxID=3342799 RepID=UPI0035B95CAF
MDTTTNPADGVTIAYRVTAATGTAEAARSNEGSETGPIPAPEATPIVLVHGTALSQAIWRGFGYLKALSPDRPVVTLDLRGHGRSGKLHDEASYAMDRFVGDVLAVLDAAGIERAHYLGYSLGARVGFSLAASHPERLASFTSLGGAPGTGRGAFDRVFFEGTVQALEHGGMAGFLAGWERASGHPLDPLTRQAFEANDPAALAAYMRANDGDPRVPDADIAAFSMPLLLLAGTRDTERLRAAEHVHSLLPHSELHTLDAASHGDTPRHPQVIPLLKTFLERVPKVL